MIAIGQVGEFWLNVLLIKEEKLVGGVPYLLNIWFFQLFNRLIKSWSNNLVHNRQHLGWDAQLIFNCQQFSWFPDYTSGWHRAASYAPILALVSLRVEMLHIQPGLAIGMQSQINIIVFTHLHGKVLYGTRVGKQIRTNQNKIIQGLLKKLHWQTNFKQCLFVCLFVNTVKL